MSAVPVGFQFRVPWHPTDQPLHEELAREMSEQHLLFEAEARAVARRQDNDDVLFEILETNQPAAFAVVHLTWKGRPDQFPTFPSTQVYSTFSQWVNDCMMPDANEWDLIETNSE